MAHSLQGVYSPLPQSLSDSDSEKELVMENICSNYSNKNINMTKLGNQSASRQNGHININLNKDVLKIKHVKPKMSTLRKIAFAFSILLCCLPIIIFLWVLPCSSSNTCPINVLNWEYQQDDIELKGKINLVHSVFKNSYNLALMYKGSLNSGKSFKNGVISFVGSNGATAWFVEQENDPYELDCTILDVDGNGINDCLLLDGRGLKAIETISGSVIWHVHSHDDRNTISDLSMAVKLSDFNADNIDEILTVYQSNNLLVVCGKTGKALSSIKFSSLCNEIHDLARNNDQVRMACKNGTQIKYYEIPVNDLHKKFSNARFTIKPTKIFGENNEKVYIAGNRKLIVENNDNCPHCHSSITLYDNKENKLKVWPFFNSYVMEPEPVSFQNTKQNMISLKGLINGFIIKIWQWGDNKQKKTILGSQIHKREVPMKNESYYLNVVTERLMLIMFNNTNIHVINASQTELNQLCLGSDNKVNCQPNYNNQDSSLLVADLNLDESQEMISYTSSYVQRQDDSWHLVSYFKVFRLEGELPKLYGVK